MRIRFGFGLPGPFFLSPGRSRGGRGGLVFAAALVVLLSIAEPWIGLGVAAFIALVVVCVVHDQRQGIRVRRRR